MKEAYFAGGCFWCITPIFDELEGVLEVIVGYSGGDEFDPKYEDVKNQKTGHRETVCIRYEPDKVSYDELIDVFLSHVDPFDDSGQFIDRGYSYTLALYYQTDEEKIIGQQRIDALRKTSGKPVFIHVERFKGFYIAEDYHQKYYLKNPEAFSEEMMLSGRNDFFKKKELN